MNILVTGGAGFIGSRFVEMLISGEIVNDFHKVVVLDKLTYSGNKRNLDAVIDSKKLVFIEGDICDPILIHKILEDESISHLVNFAAESHVDRSINSPRVFFETNVLGTLTLLEAAWKFGNVRFLQVSTDEVYGSIKEGSWEEDFPLAPNSPYSSSKASADLLVLSFFKTYNMNVAITRCSNNYGIRQFPEKVIPRFIINLLEGQKIPIYGRGEQIREWIHVDDHCIGIFLVLMQGKPGEIFNIGGNIEMKNIELAKTISDIFKLNVDSVVDYVPDRLGHDFRYSLSGNKIQSTFGFRTNKNFKEELELLVNWYKENRDWWEPLLERSKI